MTRPSLVIWGLFALGCVGFLGYSYATRTRLADSAKADMQPGASGWVTDPGTGAPPPTDERVESRAAPASSDPVFALASDASSKDAATRATAIRALADAPPKQAISVLQEVLNSGDPRTDRPLALNSLREMALNHGDADNRIRDAIRYAIQNGDAAFVQTAQAALSEIENRIRDGESASVH